MKQKRTIKQRFKEYFTEKPKQDFWFWAFITLLVFRYVSYPVIIFLLFFNIGLVSPELEVEAMDKVFITASENITNAFVGIMEKVFLFGQGIAQNNPIVAKILFFGLSNLVWVFWIAMFGLIINLFRYGISWFIRRKK